MEMPPRRSDDGDGKEARIKPAESNGRLEETFFCLAAAIKMSDHSL
jgi:hypothetical protein